MDGAIATATVFSIINTAAANHLELYKYLEFLFRQLPNLSFKPESPALDEYLPWSDKMQLEFKIQYTEDNEEEKLKVKLPNINFIMNMTKEFLDGEIDDISYSLAFPYELEKRYEKMEQEDEDYCYLIYRYLYEEGVTRFDELSDPEFKS